MEEIHRETQMESLLPTHVCSSSLICINHVFVFHSIVIQLGLLLFQHHHALGYDPLFLLLLHILNQKGIFQSFTSWGAFWGSRAVTRKGRHQPAQRLTGCPGSVITVLMLSILKVQYCDNWRMAANLPSIRGSSPSVAEGRQLKEACERGAGTPGPSYTVPLLSLLLQVENIVLSVPYFLTWG